MIERVLIVIIRIRVVNIKLDILHPLPGTYLV